MCVSGLSHESCKILRIDSEWRISAELFINRAETRHRISVSLI